MPTPLDPPPRRPLAGPSGLSPTCCRRPRLVLKVRADGPDSAGGARQGLRRGPGRGRNLNLGTSPPEGAAGWKWPGTRRLETPAPAPRSRVSEPLLSLGNTLQPTGATLGANPPPLPLCHPLGPGVPPLPTGIQPERSALPSHRAPDTMRGDPSFSGRNALPAVRAQPHGPSACPESKPPVFPTDRFSNWGPHHPCSGSAIC